MINEIELIYKAVPVGEETTFLLKRLNDLLDNSAARQSEYTKCKQNGLHKLYKLVDGRYMSKNVQGPPGKIYYANERSAKAGYVLTIEVLLMLPDGLHARFSTKLADIMSMTLTVNKVER